nr:protein S-acyltransferase 10 [Ipomoea batatas]
MGALCGFRDTWDRFSDRCFGLFPCLSDPARRATLGLKVALVMLHVVYAGVLFIINKDLVEKTRQEPWYTAMYLSLFIVTLAQYFITSGSSPG